MAKKERKREKKVMLSEAVLTRFRNLSYFCFVFLNFILRNVKVPGLSLLINKVIVTRDITRKLMSIKLRYWKKRIQVRHCYAAVWVENKRSH